MTTDLHVATTGSDRADGSADRPLHTINHAAQLAQPGDTVIVHAGEYREWVRPRHGGLSDQRRITYTAAPASTSSSRAPNRSTAGSWSSGTVWSATVPNTLFGDFNPFAEEIDGDWIVYADAGSPKKHLGEVYLNGISFYEVDLP